MKKGKLLREKTAGKMFFQSCQRFKEYDLKFPVCIIKCGLEMGNSGLTTVSSNNSNDKNILEGIEKSSNVVNQLLAIWLTSIKSVASTGAQITEQIT